MHACPLLFAINDHGDKTSRQLLTCYISILADFRIRSAFIGEENLTNVTCLSILMYIYVHFCIPCHQYGLTELIKTTEFLHT